MKSGIDQQGNVCEVAIGFRSAGNRINSIYGKTSSQFGIKPFGYTLTAANPKMEAGVKRNLAIGCEWFAKELLKCGIHGYGTARISLDIKSAFFGLGRG